MSVEEVARVCGLPLLQARLAKLREYDEPFRLLDPSPQARSRLLRALHRRGLRCARSSRFEHLTGRTDKGVAVAALRGLYERAVEEPLVTIGLGDSLSDLPLLRAVDIPIIVDNQDAGASDRLLRKVPTARLTDNQGPRGWAEAITGALEMLQVKAMPNWQHAAAG
jgi:mannosyl-3-phosphoglycerate phosphatase